MPSGPLLLAFLATAAVIVAIPGPSLLFTIGRAITVGRRAALLVKVIARTCPGCTPRSASR